MAVAPRPRGYQPEATRPRPGGRKTELSASERGYDWQWKKMADLVRDRDGGLCQDCLDEGGLPMAMESLINARHAHDVDHIIPVHARPDLKMVMSNLRTRCPLHHARKTAEDVNRYGAADRTIAFPAT